MLEINKIYNLDNLEGLKLLDDNSIDSIVTDPPYHLTQEKYKNIAPAKEHLDTPFGRARVGARGFMGKEWDGGDTAFKVELWRECLRVLKPGGHLLAFGGSRTYHRMACAIEDAGFEIRDQIMWVYSQGFPKSQNLSKAIDRKLGVERKVVGKREHPTLKDKSKVDRQESTQYHASNSIKDEWDLTEAGSEEAKEWEGWGTALKPSHEPIVMARKPLSEKTYAENVLKWGTGGINIDGCRIKSNENISNHSRSKSSSISKGIYGDSKEQTTSQTEGQKIGRFPANLLHDGSQSILDLFPNNNPGCKPHIVNAGEQAKANSIEKGWGTITHPNNNFTGYDDGDNLSAARFFYSAKASKRERGINNSHPCVKPLVLIKYLITLVTPKDGITLDIFSGSGTHALAAKELGFKFINFELEKDYCNIANERLK